VHARGGAEGGARAASYRARRRARPARDAQAPRRAEQSIQPGTLTTDQFAKFIRSERDKFAKVVKDAGIPLQ